MTSTLQPCPAEPAAPKTPGRSSLWITSARNRAEKIFRTGEVDGDPLLKIICGSLLLYYFLTFNFWWQHSVPLSTQGNEVFDYAPAAVFQNLRWLVFMDSFQTKTYFYALGMLALLGLFSLLYQRSSLLALGLLAWLFANKLFFYLCDFRLFANYHHFHLFYTLVFLVGRDKLRCFRAALGLSYVMSAAVKLSPSWLFGEYFNSVPGKLPLLPKESWVVTAACVALMALEFLGPMCWLTRIRWLRRASFWAFILFHAYSGVIVGFWYTTLMLPLAVTAFLRFHEPLHAGWHFSPRDLPTLGLFAALLLGGSCHFFIPGDTRLTGEGRYFGLFMFDASRSTTFEAEIRKGNKMWVVHIRRPFRNPNSIDGFDPTPQISCDYFQDGRLTTRLAPWQIVRDGDDVIFNPQYFSAAKQHTYGDPYLYWFYARELVRRYRPDRVSLRLDERLNGHPETVRLLDIPDFARLNPSYNPFGHNQWILLPGPESPAAYRWP